MLRIKKKSLEWALNHINRFNDTYIFPLPFEFKAINEYKDEVIGYLCEQDISSFGVRNYRSEITPKSQFGFRVSTQLDPLDSIIYNAVLYEIAEYIESSRISIDKNIVYSYRLAPEKDGTLYSTKCSWDAFNKEAKRLAECGKYNYVVITDIADFFPSIYLHNVETTLRECVRDCGRRGHADALINVIKAMHSNQTHKGLPIGPQFSRPLAELILNDIDNILQKENIRFIRYVDDYRLFCTSEFEAYKTLSLLAQKLYDLRNLKLNEQKTCIVNIDKFLLKHLSIFQEKESSRIMNEFYELCDRLEINPNSYEDFDEDSISEDEWAQVEQLNLFEMLEDEFNKDKIDLGFVTFLLNNLSRFNDENVADLILEPQNFIKITPIMRSFINYLMRVSSLSDEDKVEIGARIINLFSSSYLTELQFNRIWLLHLFTENDEWNNKAGFVTLYKKYNDDITRREIVQCLGRAKNYEFFREFRMTNMSSLNPWLTRSFITAFSCLPKDERDALYSSRKYMQRDYLEQTVHKWSMKNHY